MKRHVTASTERIGTDADDDGDAGAGVADRTHAASSQNARGRAGSGKPSLVLASAKVWTHTLVPTGELNHRSAHALEAEIERRCEEGVTGITLDLRALTEIDAIGVAVIAFRSDLCKRRGYDFELIPGSEPIQRAFEKAGVADVLPFRRENPVSR